MKVKQASRLNSVKEYYFSKKLKEIADLRAEGKDIINLGIGNPDLPPSEATRKGLETAVWENNTHGYQSYRGVPQLRNGIASWYKRFYQVEVNYENEVLPLIGSKEGIMHISMSFLEPGDEALVPNPGYPAYRTASMLAGAKVVNYNLKEELGWMPDLKELEQQDLSKVKIMWVNFPNMPTGATANLDFYKRLIAFAKRNEILIVNDNPYSFILQDQPMSLLSIEGAKDVAMELNSLSKSHNMAGWRVGMLIGKKEWIDIVLKFKSKSGNGDESGEAAYNRYGKNVKPLLEKVGAKAIWAGNVKKTVIGDYTSQPDRILIVYYPSKEAFIEMSTSEAYLKIGNDRKIALEYGGLIATETIDF